jgi:hypothetical protein
MRRKIDRSSRECLTVEKFEGLVVPAPNSASSDNGSVNLYLQALVISVMYVGEWPVHFLDTPIHSVDIFSRIDYEGGCVNRTARLDAFKKRKISCLRQESLFVQLQWCKRGLMCRERKCKCQTWFDSIQSGWWLRRLKPSNLLPS